MKWAVTGADRRGGGDKLIVVNGEDETAARANASRLGVLVADILPVDENQEEPPPLPDQPAPSLLQLDGLIDLLTEAAGYLCKGFLYATGVILAMLLAAWLLLAFAAHSWERALGGGEPPNQVTRP